MTKLEQWNDWRNSITRECYGNWNCIAESVCSNQSISTLLKGTNISCPECNRRDKLYIVDSYSLAAHCCSMKCNAHFFDGIALIAALDGTTQTDVLKDISILIGLSNDNVVKKPRVLRLVTKEPEVPIVNEKAVKEIQQITLSVQPIQQDNLVYKYLENRGLEVQKLPSTTKENVFFHNSLSYYKKILDNNDIVIKEEKGVYPAMVGQILDADFEVIGFHKTYLSDNGQKALVYEPKQLTKALYRKRYAEKGAFIKLCEPTDGRYGIAEGIETALAVLCMNRPCWSTISANGISNFVVPTDCKILDLYGDLDRSGTGQHVILSKYYQLLIDRPEIKVNLFLPPENLWNTKTHPKGIDFLDAYNINKSILPPLGGFKC